MRSAGRTPPVGSRLPLRDRQPDVAEALLGRARCLAGRAYTAEELPGGLTNRNLKVTTDDRRLVVRIASANAGLLAIDRDDEYRNSAGRRRRAAWAPRSSNTGRTSACWWSGFLDGRDVFAGDLGDRARLGRIAAACRQLHAGPRFRNASTCSPAAVLPVDRARDTDSAYRTDISTSCPTWSGSRPPWPPPTTEQSRATTICWPGTVSTTGAGSGSSTTSTPATTTRASSWATCGASRRWASTTSTSSITAYYGRFDPQKVARARLQGLMSKYGWTLWASIQDGAAASTSISGRWGMEKYERAVAEFTGRDFDDLLDAAGGADR